MVSPLRLKGYAALASMFLLGAMAGAGGSYAFLQRQYDLDTQDRAAREESHLRALTRELDLTPEQRDRIREIMERNRARHRELLRSTMDRCGMPLAEHKRKVDTEIRALLTPEQQPRFDKLLEKQRERSLWGSLPDAGPDSAPEN